MTLSKDGLLKKNVSGVKSTKHSCLVYGDTSFSFSEVMEAIFISGLFFYTPRDDASGLDELKASLSGLELKNQMRLRLAMKQIKNIPWS